MRRVVVFYADFGEDAIKTRYRECPVRGIFDPCRSQDSALRRKIERRLSSGRTAALCKVHGPQWVDDRHSLANAERLQSMCGHRTRQPRPSLEYYTSVCSAIPSASSTSIPRYLTVLASFVWPSRS